MRPSNHARFILRHPDTAPLLDPGAPGYDETMAELAALAEGDEAAERAILRHSERYIETAGVLSRLLRTLRPDAEPTPAPRALAPGFAERVMGVIAMDAANATARLLADPQHVPTLDRHPILTRGDIVRELGTRMAAGATEADWAPWLIWLRRHDADTQRWIADRLAERGVTLPPPAPIRRAPRTP